MTTAQHAAWLEHTGYSPEQFPLELAIETLTNRKIGNYHDRRSLETFLAGWNAAEEYRMNTQALNLPAIGQIFSRSKP